MDNTDQETQLMRIARIFAENIAEGYVLHNPEKCKPVSLWWGCLGEGRCESASDVFNRVATPEQKTEFNSLYEHILYTGPIGSMKCFQDELKKAELLVSVLVDKLPEAEKDMVAYSKYAADSNLLEGIPLTEVIKVYEDAGASTLARIATQAVTHPPCPEKPKAYNFYRLKIS